MEKIIILLVVLRIFFCSDCYAGKIEISSGNGSSALSGRVSLSRENQSVKENVHDSGKIKKEERSLSEFQSIVVKTIPCSVTIYSGEDSNSVIISSNASIASLIITEVRDKTVFILTKEDIVTDIPISLEIKTKKFSFLNVTGSIDVNAKNVHADKLQIEVSGSASVAASGAVRELETAVSGNAVLRFGSLIAERCAVRIDGVGDAVVHAVKRLQAEINGIGKIAYYGHPSAVQKKIHGVGTIVSMSY